MIDRYSTRRMKEIWSEENKFSSFLKVEIETLKILSSLKKIPHSEFLLIQKKAKIDLKRIQELEFDTKHDVIAFTRSISEQLGNEKKWFHFGLTSTDVVDTAHALQFKSSNAYIKDALIKFSQVLRKQAIKYKKVPVIGRTHGIHAEVTSFGLKWALWYDEMSRNIERFNRSSKQIEIGKISGAVGTHVIIDSKTQDLICKALDLKSAKISTQILQRDRHIEYISSLVVISTTLEKIALEIRNLQRTEIKELEERFSIKQKGSSAMPHKKNPISSENISGCARMMRGFLIPIFENNALWHERDISHSSVERIVFPDALNLLDYMLSRFSITLEEIVVYPENMLKNINLTNGVIFSQRILNLLIESGLSRENAYDLIQPLAIKAYNENKSFKVMLLNEEKIVKQLSRKIIENAFEFDYFLKHVDQIFKRVF